MQGKNVVLAEILSGVRKCQSCKVRIWVGGGGREEEGCFLVCLFVLLLFFFFPPLKREKRKRRRRCLPSSEIHVRRLALLGGERESPSFSRLVCPSVSLRHKHFFLTMKRDCALKVVPVGRCASRKVYGHRSAQAKANDARGCLRIDCSVVGQAV